MSKAKKTNAPKSTSYQKYLIESLKDPEEAAGYLNAALEGGDIHVFLLALQNVIKAREGHFPCAFAVFNKDSSTLSVETSCFSRRRKRCLHNNSGNHLHCAICYNICG